MTTYMSIRYRMKPEKQTSTGVRGRWNIQVFYNFSYNSNDFNFAQLSMEKSSSCLLAWLLRPNIFSTTKIIEATTYIPPLIINTPSIQFDVNCCSIARASLL